MYCQVLEFAKFMGERKAVILLGGPASGKSHIAKELVKKGFIYDNLDSHLEQAFVDLGHHPKDKIHVDLDDPNHYKIYRDAAHQSNLNIKQLIDNGVNIVTEKIGQFYNTVAKMVRLFKENNYKTYGIYCVINHDIAWQRNIDRKRVITNKDKFYKSHRDVAKNIHPSEKGSGLRILFDQFYIINTDGSPESKAEINEVIYKISS